VPLVIRWPGRVKPGSSCDTPVIGIDFYPTILDMADIRKPLDYILDGESILPLLAGVGPLKREAVFWHFPAYLEGDSYQGARDPYFRTRPAGAVRKGEWKLIEYFENGQIELYNLGEDICEKRDLAAEMPWKAKELHNLLVRWRSSVGAPVPRQVNPEYDPAGD
jgi:arylsulfatase A-like enzyme